MSAKPDYYEVLGIARGADEDAIKSAYRKLARKFHPDVNKEADAAKKFNEVQQAYDVLSDPQKRKLYDQFGHAGVESGAAAGAGPRGRWSQPQPGPGFDTDFDAEDLGSMFEAFFGGRGPGRSSARAGRARPASPPPDDLRHTITTSFMTAAKGGVENVRVTVDGRARTIEVKIPPGTPDGSSLRVRGGASSDDGGADLILTVRVGGHPLFRRGEGHELGKGLDLYLDLPLTIAEAALGTTVAVPTLDGKVELAVPAGAGSGKKLRLKGRGIRDASGKQGDLYAVLQVVFPGLSSLSPEERDMLRSIAAKTPSPRSGPEWDA
jgi:DnaJ-class molecular chaperone